MNIVSIVFLALILLITSCRKDQKILDNKQHSLENKFMPDQYMRSFTEYERSINITVEGHQMCTPTYIHRNYSFRLTPGLSSGNKYFYKMEKSVVYDNCQTPCAYFDWEELAGYYRYDFQNQKSYFYQDTSDINPQLLMDFSATVGDTINLDSSATVKFVVDTKHLFMMEGVTFPLINGRIIKIRTTNYTDFSVGKQFILTPFGPNVAWSDQNFIEYFTPTWGYNDFCGYSLEETINSFSFKSTNVITDDVLFSFYVGFGL